MPPALTWRTRSTAARTSKRSTIAGISLVLGGVLIVGSGVRLTHFSEREEIAYAELSDAPRDAANAATGM